MPGPVCVMQALERRQATAQGVPHETDVFFAVHEHWLLGLAPPSWAPPGKVRPHEPSVLTPLLPTTRNHRKECPDAAGMPLQFVALVLGSMLHPPLPVTVHAARFSPQP